jgi:hypothetical protein
MDELTFISGASWQSPIHSDIHSQARLAKQTMRWRVQGGLGTELRSVIQSFSHSVTQSNQIPSSLKLCASTLRPLHGNQ